MRTDQYGNPLPPIKNLAVIGNMKLLTLPQISKIFEVEWFDCDGFVLIDWTKLNDPGLAEIATTDPEDCGGLDLTHEIGKVNDILKRGNLEDGFYHA